MPYRITISRNFPKFFAPVAVPKGKEKDELIKKLREARKNTTFRSPLTKRNKKVFATSLLRKIINRMTYWYYGRN